MRRTAPIVLAALLACAACGGTDSAGSSPALTPGSDAAPTQAGAASTEPIAVAASTDVYGAIASTIGGDRVDVTSFIDGPDKDPHEYESTPADAAAVQAARVVVGNGGGYDDFVFKLADAAGGKRTVIDVARLSGLEAQVPEGEEFNEHMWFSLPTMKKLADQLATDLGTLSPDDASTFTANAGAFDDKVDALMADTDKIKSSHAGDRVATTEPLPLYLTAAAGLENVTPEEFMEASEEGTDAPAAVVQETLEQVTGPEPAKVLLLNTQTQTPATDRLRAAVKSKGIAEVDVNETLSSEYSDYVAWMSAQIDALGTALAG